MLYIIFWIYIIDIPTFLSACRPLKFIVSAFPDFINAFHFLHRNVFVPWCPGSWAKDIRDIAANFIVRKDTDARIEAHLRRERREKIIRRKVFGDITIDYSAREVHVRGEKIHFNRKELSTNN